MANVDRPQGLRPKGDVLRANEYVAAGAIYPGDAVAMTAAGKVVAASASDPLCGVAAGYAAADGDAVLVWDHPEQMFLVQADGADIDAQTDINLNYDFVATAGDSAYRVSRMELDSSTGATTAALPLKLLAVDKRPDNALGANVDCIVKINNHKLAGGTGTVGI